MRKITSLQHPLVKRLVKLRSSKKARFEGRSIVVEGKNLIHDLCGSTLAKTILVKDPSLLSGRLKAEQVFEVSEEILAKISSVKAPEGILAELPYPEQASLVGVNRLLVLDGVADPGNLGTLLRTAFALGWQGVYLLENCCDPFNDKALRAAKGATFRLPLRQGNWDDLDRIVKKEGLFPLCADLVGKKAEKFVNQEKILLVLGGEANGPSSETIKRCQQITIPMPGNMESLNVAVAGGILMYLLS